MLFVGSCHTGAQHPYRAHKVASEGVERGRAFLSAYFHSPRSSAVCAWERQQLHTDTTLTYTGTDTNTQNATQDMYNVQVVHTARGLVKGHCVVAVRQFARVARAVRDDVFLLCLGCVRAPAVIVLGAGAEVDKDFFAAAVQLAFGHFPFAGVVP